MLQAPEHIQTYIRGFGPAFSENRPIEEYSREKDWLGSRRMIQVGSYPCLLLFVPHMLESEDASED
jgi:hypothetical protein